MQVGESFFSFLRPGTLCGNLLSDRSFPFRCSSGPPLKDHLPGTRFQPIVFFFHQAWQSVPPCFSFSSFLSAEELFPTGPGGTLRQPGMSGKERPPAVFSLFLEDNSPYNSGQSDSSFTHEQPAVPSPPLESTFRKCLVGMEGILPLFFFPQRKTVSSLFRTLSRGQEARGGHFFFFAKRSPPSLSLLFPDAQTTGPVNGGCFLRREQALVLFFLVGPGRGGKNHFFFHFLEMKLQTFPPFILFRLARPSSFLCGSTTFSPPPDIMCRDQKLSRIPFTICGPLAGGSPPHFPARR